MFQYLYSLFTTGIYRKIWLKVLIVFSILLVIVFANKRFMQNSGDNTEGFEQKDNFVLKYNDNIYDNFYAEIYDKIHKPQVDI